MRFDPRRRLERRVPGADVQPAHILRLAVDEARAPRPDPVPPRDLAAHRSSAVRPSHRLASVGPHAPQLIRLIRTPYALSVARGQRQTAPLRAPSLRTRPAFSAALRDAHADWPEVGSASPIQARPRPFAARPLAPEPVPSLPIPGRL